MKKLLCILLAVLMLAGCSGTAPEETTTAPTTTAATTEPTETTVVPDKLIALTFDDGPNTLMLQFVSVLNKYDAKGTFFVIGNGVSTNRDAVRKAYESGHEIGNHGFNHLNLTDLTADEILYEVEECQKVVELVTGERPAFFRPPFLAVNDQVNSLIDLPYASGFTIGDGSDANSLEDRIYKILSQAQDGAIILMHCGSTCHETLEALHTVIPELRSQGYEFVTVSELFERKGIDPEDGVMYKIVE